MSVPPQGGVADALALAFAFELPYEGLRDAPGEAERAVLLAPSLQRALRLVPLGMEPDGTLRVAGADPLVDLSVLRRPARLVLASADDVDRVLGTSRSALSLWDAMHDWPEPARRRGPRGVVVALALATAALLAALALAAWVVASREDDPPPPQRTAQPAGPAPGTALVARPRVA